MTVLLVKLLISISPVFLNIKNSTVIQLDKESKSDKDDTDKETSKDKKIVDENFVHWLSNVPVADFTFIKKNLHFLSPLYRPTYYATVHTPPPDNYLI